MEFLMSFGVASKELFNYNRENYQFDQSQRLDRELMRLEMQIKRFELFREDIRDLVELCVDRMKMYHLIGAMFLEFCVALYCEGRLKASAPPFVLGLFYLSVASSFLYLVLTVWLSMHASICAHSFGVRLLCRYVRLPIPSIAQIGALNARLAEFERQGVQMLRVPFVGGSDQQWLQRSAQGAPPQPQLPPVQENSNGAASSSGQQRPQQQPRPEPGPNKAVMRDLLGQGTAALLSEEAMMHKATSKVPGVGKHVMLFRRLSCKWQVYDAYARVCMSLGCNMILQSICYYLINICLFEYQAKSCCIALLVAFQSAALVIAYIDVGMIGKCWVLLMQMFAILPCFIAATSIMWAMNDKERFEDVPVHRPYPMGPVCYVLVAIWFECLIWLSWPSKDEASLPRRFRAVLFLDVFEEAIHDPTKVEDGDKLSRKERKALHGQQEQDHSLAERAAAADEALHVAHCALRRWEAVPAGSSDVQHRTIKRLRAELSVSRQALNGEASRLAARQGLRDAASLLDDDHRPWDELSEREQAEDPLTGMLLGPFEHQGRFGGPSSYHFDLERQDFVWQIGAGQRVLTLEEVAGMVQSAEQQVRQVLDKGPASTTGSSSDGGGGTISSPGESDEDGPARKRKHPRSSTAKFVSEAMGKMDGPYVPQRLPWKIVRYSTRAVQLAWLLMALLLLVEVIKPSFGFDAQVILPEAEEGGEATEASGEGTANEGSEATEGSDEGTTNEGSEATEGSDEGTANEGSEATETRGEGIVNEEAHSSASAGAPAEAAAAEAEAAASSGAAEAPAEGPAAEGAAAAPAPSGGAAVEAPAGERRLRSAWQGWRFTPLRASWPQRKLFRPEMLSCLPEPEGGLLIGTHYELYKADWSNTSGAGSSAELPGPRRPSKPPLELQPMPRSGFPTGATAICALPRGGALSTGLLASHCLLGSVTPDGLALWPFGGDRDLDAVQLPVDSDRPWRLVSGASMPCSSVSELLVLEEDRDAEEAALPLLPGSAATPEQWCLLLVGWDGERLPVAALRLPDGPSRPPARGSSVVPIVDAPIRLLRGMPGATGATVTKDADEVLALHVGVRGRLWALLADGALQAWDVLAPRSLGRWSPQWSSAGQGDAFHGAAVCEEPHGRGLLVAGQSVADGAHLLRATIPSSLG